MHNHMYGNRKRTQAIGFPQIRATQVPGSEGRHYRGRTKGGLGRSQLRIVARLQKPAVAGGAVSRSIVARGLSGPTAT
jgi:hypothetical protein